MRAVGYRAPGPIDAPESLVDIELPRPVASGRDLLVAVNALSVNPIDTKVRRGVAPAGDGWKVLGWDVAGTVIEAGPDATLFAPGDAVFYAGALNRQGCNAEYHLVDERLVGPRPASLDWAGSAALPLTAITAWEVLFDRLGIAPSTGDGGPIVMPSGGAPAILIIGAGGGVGSIAVQLARQLTDLTVIATASRAETHDWVSALGAHHIIDHSRPLAAQVAELGIGAPAYVFSISGTGQQFAEVAELIAPQGRYALIDDPSAFDIMPFKRKSVSIHWESMFTRSLFDTPDVARQGAILAQISQLIDAGTLRTTLAENFGPVDAAAIRRAHALLESGKARGKIVLEGFAGAPTAD